MVKRKFILSFSLVTSFLWFLSSCKDKCKVDEFSFGRENYSGNAFRLAGYYQRYDIDSQGDTGYHYKLFYRNGVCINLGASDLKKLEQSFTDGSFVNSLHYNRDFWGIYSVVGDSLIRIEYWFPKYTCGSRVLTSSWKISNDTTIVLLNGNNVVKDVKELHFKHFLPKPDSTN